MRTGPVAAALLAVLVLTGCSTEVTGTAVIAKGAQPAGAAQVSRPAELPYGENAPLADAYATMRTWDVCALHDPAAAQELLRSDGSEQGGAIEPYLNISSCKLAVDVDGGGTWEFNVDLQELGGVYSGAKPKPETVGGVQVLATQDATTGGCTYELPFRKVAAIALTVETYEDTPPSRVCEVAKSYLERVLPVWQQPPTVDAGRTTPALRMAGQDPCAGLVPFRQELASRTTPDYGLSAELADPVSCELNGSLRGGGFADYEVVFTMSTPDELTDGEPVQVAGLTGIRDTIGDCQFLFGFGNDPIVLGNTGGETVDTLEVSLPDCSQPEPVLTKLLGAYQQAFTRKLPEAGPDALRLGDLNPPATPADVGAPFDPCTVISWADFPAGLAGEDPSEPHLSSFTAEDPTVQTGCTFHEDAVVTTVAWGKDPLDTLMADPEFAEGGQRRQVDGRESVRFAESGGGEKPSCADFLTASKGVIGISTTQNYSQVQPCSVNDALVGKIAAKVR